MDGRRERARRDVRILAAGFFGLGLFAMGRLAEDLPINWIVFPSRTLAVLLVTLPIALIGRLRMTRDALPYIRRVRLPRGRGLVAYTIGARHGIAIAAILGSQFAAFAAVAAYFVFRERLARVQVAGVAVTAIGVAVLTGVQAV